MIATDSHTNYETVYTSKNILSLVSTCQLITTHTLTTRMSLAFKIVSNSGAMRMRPGANLMLRSQTIKSSCCTFPCSPTSSSTSSSNPSTHAISLRYFTAGGKADEKDETVVYEGPFSSLALRLKRISIASAVASVVGIPLLITYGSNIPPSGQLAVGGTAILAACGSTVALTFCFSPYIHTLEWIPVKRQQQQQQQQCTSPTSADADADADGDGAEKGQKMLMKATTINFFAMRVETVFDPDTDVNHDPKTYRPFCNFMVKDKPLFFHPQLLHDDELRIKLLGVEKGTLIEESAKEDDGKKKDPDDDFL